MCYVSSSSILELEGVEFAESLPREWKEVEDAVKYLIGLHGSLEDVVYTSFEVITGGTMFLSI